MAKKTEQEPNPELPVPVEETKQDEPVKRIFRSKTDKVISGVCGGVAQYFNLDPILVRVIWAAAVFFGGTGMIAYIAAWIIIPEDPNETSSTGKGGEKQHVSAGIIGGVILILFGLLMLSDHYGFPFHHFPMRFGFDFDFGLLIALVSIGIGAYLLINRNDENNELAKKFTEKFSAGDGSRKLTRSIADRKVAGVCGGMAQYFQIDTSFVRIGFVLFAFATAFIAAIVVYIVMIILVPEENANITDQE